MGLICRVRIRISSRVAILTLVRGHLSVRGGVVPIASGFFMVSGVQDVCPFPSLSLATTNLFTLISLGGMFGAPILVMSSRQRRATRTQARTISKTSSITVRGCTSFLYPYRPGVQRGVSIYSTGLCFSNGRLIRAWIGSLAWPPCVRQVRCGEVSRSHATIGATLAILAIYLCRIVYLMWAAIRGFLRYGLPPRRADTSDPMAPRSSTELFGPSEVSSLRWS